MIGNVGSHRHGQAGLNLTKALRQGLGQQRQVLAGRHHVIGRIDQFAVGAQAQHHLGVARAVVGDAREELRRAGGAAARGQRGDGQIVARAAHRQPGDPGRQLRQQGRITQAAVADDDEAELAGLRRAAQRQRQCGGPVSAALPRLRAPDSRLQGGTVRAGGGQQLRLFRHAYQRQAVAAAEGVDHVQGLLLRCAKARPGRHVTGVHTGRGIQQQDDVAAARRRHDDEGPRQRQHQRRQNQQLQQEQQIAPQPLPGRVGLGILQQLLPQHDAGNLQLLATQAQHVEQDDRDGQQAAGQRERRQQLHGPAPPAPLIESRPGVAGRAAGPAPRACPC